MAKRPFKPSLRIGFFAPTDYEYVPRLADGILRYQEAHGGIAIRHFRYDAQAPEDQDAWARQPRPWESWEPHGLIANISADAGLAEWVDAGGIPVVNTSSAAVPLPAVHISYEGLARTAYVHLSRLGFQHFAYVASDPIDLRAAAFERILQAKGRPMGFLNYQSNPSHWNDEVEGQLATTEQTTELLRSSPKPMGIVASNDNVGRVVCRAAQQLGFAIPNEIGVLAIDNFSIARTCDPPLSSIHTPGDKVGYRAMEILIGLINGRPAPHREEVQPQDVYARESTIGKDKNTDMTRAIEIIRERACEGVTVEEIMEEMSMSRSTLYREFAAAIGRTPAEEISRIRLERAMELLAETDLPIASISVKLHYANPPAFTDFFKNQSGMTPSAYRKKHGVGARSVKPESG